MLRNAMEDGGNTDQHYEDACSNVISVRGDEGVQFPGKKRYVTSGP